MSHKSRKLGRRASSLSKISIFSDTNLSKEELQLKLELLSDYLDILESEADSLESENYIHFLDELFHYQKLLLKLKTDLSKMQEKDGSYTTFLLIYKRYLALASELPERSRSTWL
jgi:hypothetical protein